MIEEHAGTIMDRFAREAVYLMAGGGVDQTGYQEIDFPVGSATTVMGADFTLSASMT